MNLKKLTTDGGNANYRFEIKSATTNQFEIEATAVVDFDGDGNINLWRINQDKKLEEVTKD